MLTLSLNVKSILSLASDSAHLVGEVWATTAYDVDLEVLSESNDTAVQQGPAILSDYTAVEQP
jgi:hypothetical protein